MALRLRNRPKAGGGQEERVTQPPWNPHGRVAVVIKDRWWPGTVTHRVDGDHVHVVADCGIAQDLPLAEVHPLGHAVGFVTGRMIGLELKAKALQATGRGRAVRTIRQEVLDLSADLAALSRG